VVCGFAGGGVFAGGSFLGGGAGVTPGGGGGVFSSTGRYSLPGVDGGGGLEDFF
jgi:hypothetical protein